MVSRAGAKISAGESLGDADSERKSVPGDTKDRKTKDRKTPLEISKASYQATAGDRILRLGHKREPREAILNRDPST